MTTHFTFFESYYTSVKELNSELKAEFYEAIFEYALYNNSLSNDVNPLVKALFTLVKPNLDSSKQRREAGKQGGSKSKANSKQKQSKSKQVTSDKEKDKEKNKEKNKDKYTLFIEDLKQKVSIKTKVTITKDGKEMFKNIRDTEKLKIDYINHQLDKKEYSQRITAFMEDYNQDTSRNGNMIGLLYCPKDVS